MLVLGGVHLIANLLDVILFLLFWGPFIFCRSVHFLSKRCWNRVSVIPPNHDRISQDSLFKSYAICVGSHLVSVVLKDSWGNPLGLSFLTKHKFHMQQNLVDKLKDARWEISLLRYSSNISWVILCRMLHPKMIFWSKSKSLLWESSICYLCSCPRLCHRLPPKLHHQWHQRKRLRQWRWTCHTVDGSEILHNLGE